ncbi:MAG: transposase [Gammaproteobacteria bacterium]|nr:transposase [Gammaproteobacteria bacterium]
MSRQRRPAAEWRRIVRDQRRSGLSVAQFCRRARVQPVTFYAWRRRLRDEHSFVEVKIANTEVTNAPRAGSPAGGALELHLPRERRVLIPPGFDPPTLRALLAVLEGGVCGCGSAEASA